MKDFKKFLKEKGYKYYMKKGICVVTHMGSVDLESLTTLPEKIHFNNQGYVYLESLTTLPEGIHFNNQGSVDLESLTTLPEGIHFNNQGYVDLRSLTTLPEGIHFNNQGYVYLESLTTLPEGIQFNNQGSVYLRSLTTLPEGIHFNNQGSVCLESLTTLPEGIHFNNQGYVYLGSLTTLPEGIHFNNQGSVDLRSIDGKKVKYLKKKYLIKQVDGDTMLIESEKKRDGYTIMKARYFKGMPIKEMPSCYIAQKGKFYAHGETIKEALSDVQFKWTRENIDVSDIVKGIKEKGTVSVTEYRLLTGACKHGCDIFLKENGIKKDTLTIKEAIELTKNAYGGEKLKELIS